MLCGESIQGQGLLAALADGPGGLRDETDEQGVRPVGPGLELGMVLHADHERVAADFAGLDELAVGGEAGGDEAGLLEALAVGVVQLEAVAVSLHDLAFGVGLLGQGARLRAAGVAAEAHGAALVRYGLLLGHDMHDGIRRLGHQLGGIGVVDAQHAAGPVDDHHLESEAEAEVGHLVLAGVAHGVNHPLDAAGAEATGHDDAACVPQQVVGAMPLDVFGVHPLQLHVAGVAEAGVAQGLPDGEVGVGVLDVLAHQGDGQPVLGLVHHLHHAAPPVEALGTRYSATVAAEAE